MSWARSVIAVVDDEESVRKAFVRLFKAKHIDATAFASAREFLESLAHSRFDCVILDLQMPDMTGLDLQRHLKTVRPDLALPVIIITAYDEPGVSERCLAAGAAAYLRKPVEGSVLLAAVQTFLERPAGDGQPAEARDGRP